MPDIRHNLHIVAPPNDVFRAVATPAGLNNWWTLESSGQPRDGEVYRLFFGAPYDWRAQVTHVVDGREIAWNVMEAMEDWLPTEFGFSLAEEKGGTRVRFFHKGWEEAGDHFAHSNFCWALLLKGLKDYVEKGVVLPFEERS